MFFLRNPENPCRLLNICFFEVHLNPPDTALQKLGDFLRLHIPGGAVRHSTAPPHSQAAVPQELHLHSQDQHGLPEPRGNRILQQSRLTVAHPIRRQPTRTNRS